MVTMTNEELIEMFTRQLPALLDERPELEPQLYHIFLKTFARKEEVAAVHQEVDDFRAETRTNFEQVDNEFGKVRAEMAEGFKNVRTEIKEVVRQIDRLGSRWGIRNEDLFRATIASLLEESFGVAVETRHIKGEQFDVIISDGQHILIEITASVERKIQQRLERKRELYTQATGIEPARFILATASIHNRRAESLREAGFEVIEPEEDE